MSIFRSRSSAFPFSPFSPFPLPFPFTFVRFISFLNLTPSLGRHQYIVLRVGHANHFSETNKTWKKERNFSVAEKDNPSGRILPSWRFRRMKSCYRQLVPLIWSINLLKWEDVEFSESFQWDGEGNLRWELVTFVSVESLTVDWFKDVGYVKLNFDRNIIRRKVTTLRILTITNFSHLFVGESVWNWWIKQNSGFPFTSRSRIILIDNKTYACFDKKSVQKNVPPTLILHSTWENS